MEMISKEQVASYKRSDSYQRLRRLRNEGMKSLQGYYEKYKDKETYFKGETERKIVYERYSKGGMELPRGILTECHLEKLLIGNISHGRFIKKRTNPGFVYGYDEEGRLVVCVENKFATPPSVLDSVLLFHISMKPSYKSLLQKR